MSLKTDKKVIFKNTHLKAEKQRTIGQSLSYKPHQKRQEALFRG